MVYLFEANKMCLICKKRTAIAKVGKYGEYLCPYCNANFNLRYINKNNLICISEEGVDTPIYHRSLIKIIFNPILRVVQFYTDIPYVITSVIDKDNIGWYLIKYILSNQCNKRNNI
jgi:hypothetical protein